MLAKIYSASILGLEGNKVEVEVDLVKKGFPSFKIVGLPSKAVNEARDRVRSALINTSADFPSYRLTVNLAPADLPKEGSAFDLPIAVGILLASGQLPLRAELEKSIFLGELSLEGKLRATAGALPVTLWAKEKGYEQIFLPAGNAQEAAVVSGIRILPLTSLKDLFYHLQEICPIHPHPATDISDLIREDVESEFDLADVQGQTQAKRALIIAAAGGHNLFMLGPPGSGKTLLARTLPSILPYLTKSEALEVSRIYSVSGNLPAGQALITQRVFRSPHNTISRVGIIGGGRYPQPGEISLAHHGVLFLDEFAEFPRHVLESLRQPMEDGRVTINRALNSVTFPSRFMVVAASNPCPCGYLGSKKSVCSCAPPQVKRYHHRISGPIMDRFDLHVRVQEVERDKLISLHGKRVEKDSLTSKEAQRMIQKARNRQAARFKATPQITCNAEIGPKRISSFCKINSDGCQLLRQAYSQMKLTARGYHKILKVARTIADLEGTEEISTQAISEALCYRKKQWA
ncbi:YifB family Mg chelatase-like AAA ATPase [Patescibacteria group bacterium]|nr:YifB family Mg chelatase-like AAA ATPase [Patescibacteria group bacterium]